MRHAFRNYTDQRVCVRRAPHAKHRAGFLVSAAVGHWLISLHDDRLDPVAPSMSMTRNASVSAASAIEWISIQSLVQTFSMTTIHNIAMVGWKSASLREVILMSSSLGVCVTGSNPK